MRATGGSPAGAAAPVAVCWVALALALCAAPARAQDVLSDAAREVATCGSCTPGKYQLVPCSASSDVPAPKSACASVVSAWIRAAFRWKAAHATCQSAR